MSDSTKFVLLGQAKFVYVYTYFIYVSIFIRIAYNAAHVPRKSQQWQLVSLPYTLRYGVTASGKFGTKVRVNSHTHTHTQSSDC